ncbi:MAG TPA: glycosyltransferase [Gaiellaceae bacterium]|nr:glycosyltransferase [Gaiellaceae bacterium]
MIHAVTPYGREGPSSRVRVFEWLDRTSAPFVLSSYISHRNSRPSYIARHPFAVLAAERRLNRMAAQRPRRLLLHREASPLSRGDLERRLLDSSEFAVYDFDDALQWDWGAGGRLRRLAPKAPKAVIAAQRAHRVIAGNPVLAEWASQHNADVVVIPSCVSPKAYREKTNYEVRDPPRLGWIGSPDNEVYLRLVGPALREIHRRTGARLTLIGTTRLNLGDLERFTDRVPWSEANQHELLADLDVGIAPVPDEPYTRGKSGYKLLQYAAAGTPVVASPIGVNRDILSQLRMPAPGDQREWADAILDLLTMSVAARARLGRRARAVTQRLYSYDAWHAKWEEAVGIADSAARDREEPCAAADTRQTA